MGRLATALLLTMGVLAASSWWPSGRGTGEAVARVRSLASAASSAASPPPRLDRVLEYEPPPRRPPRAAPAPGRPARPPGAALPASAPRSASAPPSARRPAPLPGDPAAREPDAPPGRAALLRRLLAVRERIAPGDRSRR